MFRHTSEHPFSAVTSDVTNAFFGAACDGAVTIDGAYSLVFKKDDAEKKSTRFVQKKGPIGPDADPGRQ